MGDRQLVMHGAALLYTAEGRSGVRQRGGALHHYVAKYNNTYGLGSGMLKYSPAVLLTLATLDITCRPCFHMH